MLRLVEFQQRLDRVQRWWIVRQRGDQLQRRGQGDTRAPDVRVDAETECVRHVCDLLTFGDATSGTSVWLQDINRAFYEKRAESPAREFGLAAGNRDQRAALTS